MISIRKIILLLLVAVLLLRAAPADAQDEPAELLHVIAQADGVHLEWHGRIESVRRDAQPNITRLPGWSLVDIDGARLPARLMTLRLPDAVPIAQRIDRLESVPWPGGIPDTDEPIPQTLAGDQRPALASSSAPSLPDSPIVMLRDGRLRGARVVVLAVSPIFVASGTTRVATHLDATILGATVFAEDTAQSFATTAPFLVGAPGPANSAAALPSVKVRVRQPGIQRVPGAALAAAGLNLPALDSARIHLRRGGTEIALDARLGADGTLDPADELRFYAPALGDRWNAADTYWLTIESSDGPRITTRNALPGAAPVRATALERGVWRRNTLYDSLLPGADGDHWFTADLKTGPGQLPMTTTMTLTPTLPLAAGTTTLTVTGSAYTPGAHNLKVLVGASAKLTTWSGVGDWARRLAFANSAANVLLALTPGTAPDGVEPDSIVWERPVTLNVNGRGAAFVGVTGTWRYQLTNSAADRALYDVTDPATPMLLTIPAGTTTQFQDGPAPRQYLLTGPGTLHTPEISAHMPADLAAPLDADVLYIAPAVFHSALAPLVALRRAQGHTVAVVDVQAIYDAWSFGQVTPTAIRDFLRYAAATWHRAPTAVTLVGDGTSDPLNYTGRNNTTFIPPFLAMVDPWIGETACEICYAQLDGDDPLSDALPDLLLGRLPVKSAAELQSLVAKIVGYETGTGGMDWRSRVAYIADNYRDAEGNIDGAGDFAVFADQSAAFQPPGVEIQRLYYDPSPSHVGVPWREPDAMQAHARTLDLLNDGAGLVNYVGHSHQWQWAVTDPASTPSDLLGLYDADALTNGEHLPILLEMTCLTSAFQTPAYSGTTIDERLLLRVNGGAVAVWGPTGLGVAHGHDALQRGFYTALWGAPPMTTSVGALTIAGDLELFAHGGCCQDAIRTFALLGDPLTPARVQPARRTYLPIIK